LRRGGDWLGFDTLPDNRFRGKEIERTARAHQRMRPLVVARVEEHR